MLTARGPWADCALRSRGFSSGFSGFSGGFAAAAGSVAGLGKELGGGGKRASPTSDSLTLMKKALFEK